MKFTDEELENLKEWVALDMPKTPGYFDWSFPALLTRLEAAEAALGTDCYANGDCVLCKVHHERYLLWREAAGK